MRRGWLRIRARVVRLWQLAKSERASPRQIGVAIFLGTMCCMTPLLYLHLWTALLLATLLRVNRLWAAFGSQVPSLFGLLRPFIMLGEIEIGHRVLEGTWVELHADHILEQAPHMLVDWLAGAGVFGTVLGTIFGVLAYFIARRRKPAEPLAPTSESQPSGSPAPPP
jgi:uncharacterized protein (DUF2062 family)